MQILKKVHGVVCDMATENEKMRIIWQEFEFEFVDG